MVRRFGPIPRRTPPPALLAPAVLATALLASACTGPVLDDDRIVATLRAQLEGQGVRADDLKCPDLPAELGRSVRCTFTVDGQPVDAVATVSAVDGGTVTYEVRTAARPVARDVLERAVERELVEIGVPAGRVSCSGDLPAQLGATATCTLTGAEGATDWTVTTTSVDGGKIDYSIEQAGLT